MQKGCIVAPLQEQEEYEPDKFIMSVVNEMADRFIENQLLL